MCEKERSLVAMETNYGLLWRLVIPYISLIRQSILITIPCNGQAGSFGHDTLKTSSTNESSFARKVVASMHGVLCLLPARRRFTIFYLFSLALSGAWTLLRCSHPVSVGSSECVMGEA